MKAIERCINECGQLGLGPSWEPPERILTAHPESGFWGASKWVLISVGRMLLKVGSFELIRKLSSQVVGDAAGCAWEPMVSAPLPFTLLGSLNPHLWGELSWFLHWLLSPFFLNLKRSNKRHLWVTFDPQNIWAKCFQSIMLFYSQRNKKEMSAIIIHILYVKKLRHTQTVTSLQPSSCSLVIPEQPVALAFTDFSQTWSVVGEGQAQILLASHFVPFKIKWKS